MEVYIKNYIFASACAIDVNWFICRICCRNCKNAFSDAGIYNFHGCDIKYGVRIRINR